MSGLSWIARSVAVGLLVSLTLAAWENCVGAAAPRSTQMACCKNGHDDCGTVGDAMTCCEAKQPAKERLIVSELALPVAPPAPVALPLAAFAVTFEIPQWLSAQALEQSARSAPTAPAYIATGSLLV